MKKVSGRITGLVGKGLRLGLVLFVALVTLSFLHSGVDVLFGGKGRHVSGTPVVTSGVYGFGNSPGPDYARRSYAETVKSARRDSPAGLSAQDTFRESRYWLGSLDEVMRTVSRFSKN